MQKWYWIELIGFDNTQKDYGVKDFLLRTQGKVDGISILFSNVEFVVDHDNIEAEKKLALCHCSYGGYLHGDERDRQAWTNFQLRGLIKELQRNDVKVAFSLFDFFSYVTDERERIECGFLKDHKELLYLTKHGEVSRVVCPLKRMKDGVYFQDFFLEKMLDVVKYYGFDAVQFADGISSFRPSVQNGDMGDDLVEQFVVDTHRMDAQLASIGENKTAYKRRRKYIIEKLYLEWIEWLSSRWKAFYDKIYKTFKNEDVLLFFNSVWTRDPFEAYLRYGIDYKDTMYASNGIMVEGAATTSINSVGDNGGVYVPEQKKPDYLFQFALMQQNIKAYLPQVQEYTLAAIKDTYEQWNLMDVAPMEQQSAFFLRNHGFVFTGDRFENASSGPWYCLSSGVSAEQWRKLHEMEEISTVEKLVKPLGFLRVWSDEVKEEAKRYWLTRDYSRTQLSYELYASGLFVSGVVRAEHVQKVGAPLLLLNPDTFSEKERKYLEKSRLPMVILGTQNPLVGANCVYEGKYISVWMKNFEAKTEDFAALRKYDSPKQSKRSPNLPYGGLWTAPLAYNTLSKTFFKELCKIFNRLFGLPQLCGLRNDCTLGAWETDKGEYRMLITNPTHTYYTSEIELPFDFSNVSVLNKSENHKITVRGNRFFEKVCPRGTSIVQIKRK